jgi:mono/diheme cytochrome c family protein
MKKTAILLGYALTLGVSSYSFAASDIAAGKQLHDDANCMRCHAGQPYNPAKTDTYEKLVKAVSFCNVNLNTGWFDDEVEHVAAYLNDAFYKLKK